MACKMAILWLFCVIVITHGSSVNFTSVDVAFQPAPTECAVSATCEPVFNNTCLGTTVSHRYTSHVLANDAKSLADIHDKLMMWKGLQYVPKCWEVIQAFLCAVYMPKCEDGLVEIPTLDMCVVTRQPCRIVEIEQGWPDFLRCDLNGGPRFPESCPTQNAYKQVIFNTSGECESPLVATDNEKSWYDGVEGCGIQCTNPLFTKEQHDQVHIFIAVFASMCLVSTCFTLMTFFADWKNSAKYPALILFYMNGCFFVGSIGFLAQFPSGAREDIICRKDGTMRLGEPSEGENSSCAIVFVIVYYFIIAGCIWFVTLAFSWHLSFRALGQQRDVLEGKTAYFHMAAWSIPLVLVVIILATNEVDGDSVAGICFVGYQNHYYRAGFVLVPLGVMLAVGGFFLVNGLITLCNLERDNPGLLNDKAVSRIKGTIARIGLFASLEFGFIFITFACHLYEFTHQAQWEKGFQDFLVCEANVTILAGTNGISDGPLPSCNIAARPSVSAVLIHLLSMFGAGIAMSMWVWTPSTIQIWKRRWRKMTRQPINEPRALKVKSKSKMIAKAYGKKKGTAARIEEHERLSVSFEEVSHDDAIGMKFDLPSKSSMDEEFDGDAVPTKLLSRRGGASAAKKKKKKGSTKNGSAVEADIVIEPPPRRNRRGRSKQRFEQTPMKPVNMAFIEEEDEEAMARYEEEEEEEHKQIVSFMQGYRKSRENTPEEFQFMPGQMDEQDAPVLTNEQNQQNESIQGNQVLIGGNGDYQENQELQIDDLEYMNYQQQGYQGIYPSGMLPLQGYFVNYPQTYLPQGTYSQSYPQGIPMAYCNCKACMDLLQIHRQAIENIENNGELANTQEVSHHDNPGDMNSPPLTPGRITPASTIGSLGRITPASTIGSLGSSSIEYYEDGVSTDDDVELPPHLCGSVTPEERHHFGQAKTGPHSIAARRRHVPVGHQVGHFPKGYWPMGQGVMDPQQGQFLFDSIR